ncbi:MAG: ABC transporter ATP-binding protein [Ignavibacteria bacterium]|nr:ABC transporter ATP-binding protein [Ignavibacteria bacterium]MBT8382617.1 ABC transporter ATP-binding protein [Ignavibacteria bacterium]NNL21546.1 ABC transporter ATP-binding protein [Ignavibacteriaceae bacterium]
MYAIETEGLTKYYGKDRGITDLNLKINEGEIFGFIGPNGSGKTTTIRLFLSLLFPTSGRGKIFNYDIVKDGPRIKKNVGFIPTEVNYYENMTVKELIEYSARFYKVSLDHSFNKLVDALDIDLSRKIDELSMGNKKKVAVIQSLVHNPRLLILDEPTSGLDPLIQNHLFEILNEQNEKGATIFFSSHVLSDVEKFCHRVAFIKDGRIVNENDINSLKEKLLSRITYRIKEGMDDIILQTPGVISIEKNKNVTSFLYRGKMSLLLKELSQLPVENITITEPDLEEVFMHYYEGDSRDGDI